MALHLDLERQSPLREVLAVIVVVAVLLYLCNTLPLANLLVKSSRAAMCQEPGVRPVINLRKKMLKPLLATISFVLSAGTALAAGNWYVTTFGGANWKEPYGSYDSWATINVDPEVGYVVGAAVGRKLDDVGLPGFRTELEVSYRDNSIDGEFDSWCYDTGVNGHDSTFAAMINAAYDLPEVWKFKPYVLAGFGLASRRISIDPVPDNFLHNGVGTDRTGFAWQVGAGVNYPVAENISVGLGYRYFESIGLNREVVYGKETAYMTADGDNHALIAEVVFGLD